MPIIKLFFQKSILTMLWLQCADFPTKTGAVLTFCRDLSVLETGNALKFLTCVYAVIAHSGCTVWVVIRVQLLFTGRTWCTVGELYLSWLEGLAYCTEILKLLLCFAKQLTVVSVASQPPNSPQKTVGVPLNVALGQQILTVQQSAPSSPGKAIVNHTTTQVQTDFCLISSMSASHLITCGKTRVLICKLAVSSPKAFCWSWQRNRWSSYGGAGWQ